MSAIEQPSRKFPRWLLIPIALAVCAVLGFVAIWRSLAPRDHAVVSFSEFIAEVHAGHVDEITIHGREFFFRLRPSADGGGGDGVVKETIGPLPDESLLATLKPDDAKVPAPRVSVTK